MVVERWRLIGAMLQITRGIVARERPLQPLRLWSAGDANPEGILVERCRPSRCGAMALQILREVLVVRPLPTVVNNDGAREAQGQRRREQTYR